MPAASREAIKERADANQTTVVTTHDRYCQLTLIMLTGFSRFPPIEAQQIASTQKPVDNPPSTPATGVETERLTALTAMLMAVNRTIENNLRQSLTVDAPASSQNPCSGQVGKCVFEPVSIIDPRTARNLLLGQQANDAIHARLFDPEKGALQSHNVRYMDIELELEQLRAENAEDEIKSLRGTSLTHDVASVSARIDNLKAHVCDTLAHAAEDHVLAIDPQAWTARLKFNASHAVLLIGKLNCEQAQKPMDEWPADTVICDPWTGNDGKGGGGIVCRASEYPALFRSTLEKMDAERGIEILLDTGDEHLSARWINGDNAEPWNKFLDAPVRTPRFLAVRTVMADGKIDYLPLSQ